MMFALVALSLLAGPALADKPADRPANMSEKAFEKARGNPHEMVDLIVTYRTPPGLAEHDEVVGHGGKVRRTFTSIPGRANCPARACGSNRTTPIPSTPPPRSGTRCRNGPT